MDELGELVVYLDIDLPKRFNSDSVERQRRARRIIVYRESAIPRKKARAQFASFLAANKEMAMERFSAQWQMNEYISSSDVVLSV